MVSNNIVAKARNKLTICLLNTTHFFVPGYLPPSAVFAAFHHFEGEVVSNNIVAKAHNKLVICLLNTFSRSRLLTTLPQPALKSDYAVSRIECVALGG